MASAMRSRSCFKARSNDAAHLERIIGIPECGGQKFLRRNERRGNSQATLSDRAFQLFDHSFSDAGLQTQAVVYRVGIEIGDHAVRLTVFPSHFKRSSARERKLRIPTRQQWGQNRGYLLQDVPHQPRTDAEAGRVTDVLDGA